MPLEGLDFHALCRIRLFGRLDSRFQLLDVAIFLAQARTQIRCLDVHVVDLHLQVVVLGLKSARLFRQFFVAQLQSQRLVSLVHQLLLGAGVLGRIDSACKIPLGTHLLRADRHGRLETVLRVPDNPAVNGRRDQHCKECGG